MARLSARVTSRLIAAARGSVLYTPLLCIMRESAPAFKHSGFLHEEPLYARMYVCTRRMYRGGWPIQVAGRKGSEKCFACIRMYVYIYVELVKGSRG